MSARERILQRIRSAAGGGAADHRPEHVEPALASGDPLQDFSRALEAADGGCERVAEFSQVPRRVADYCARHRLRGALAVAPILSRLDWSGVLPEGVEVRFGSTAGEARVAVSQAVAGIVETGSLALASGPETPTRLNFLPDHQLVVLERGAIVLRLEDALGGTMPRALNLITGPSRTADVEQTLQLGAHGPRRLHVLLVD